MLQCIEGATEQNADMAVKLYVVSDRNFRLRRIKKVMKFACGVFSALQPVGRLYPWPNELPSFISRGATHHIGTRDPC